MRQRLLCSLLTCARPRACRPRRQHAARASMQPVPCRRPQAQRSTTPSPAGPSDRRGRTTRRLCAPSLVGHTAHMQRGDAPRRPLEQLPHPTPPHRPAHRPRPPVRLSSQNNCRALHTRTPSLRRLPIASHPPLPQHCSSRPLHRNPPKRRRPRYLDDGAALFALLHLLAVVLITLVQLPVY